jgi:raffinose/stachyose/melibiose transport system substrate-binding protein
MALAGCSSAGGTGTTTLSFTSWDTAAVMKPLITAFEKENPKIKVAPSYVSPPTYIATLQTRMLAGTASDVVILNPEDQTQLVANKKLLDLTSAPFVSNLASVNKQTYSVDGKLYGASVASWGGGVLYNEELLKKVGFTTPPQSWSEFLALSQKLKAAGITPFYEAGDGISVSLLALLGLQNEASGGTMDADIFSGKTTFEKEWTPALETWGQLFSTGVESRDTAGLTGDQVVASFVKGDVAMIGTGPWTVSTVRAGAPKMTLGFFAVPGSTKGDTFWAGAASPAYAINAKTQNKDAAEKFISFLTSKSGAELYNKGTAAITTTTNFTPVVDTAIKPMVEPVQKGKIYFASVSWPKYQNALSPYVNSLLQQFIQGKYSASETAGMIDKKLAELKAAG